MANISIRGLDRSVLNALKTRASKESISLNAFVVRLLEEATKLWAGQVQRPPFHDLDDLFGTWSQEEYREFEANTACFGEIDPEFWGERDKNR